MSSLCASGSDPRIYPQSQFSSRKCLSKTFNLPDGTGVDGDSQIVVGDEIIGEFLKIGIDPVRVQIPVSTGSGVAFTKFEVDP